MAGIGCSSGIARGTARVVSDPSTSVDGKHTILVAPSTDPGWVFLMTTASALVVEKGSALSHTAIIGRELGIPTVVGVKGATERIPEGSWVQVDGGSGEVEVLDPVPTRAATDKWDGSLQPRLD